jgi:hypothetical protein
MTQPDDNYPPQVQKARRHIENGLGSLLDEFERQRLAAERAQGRAREARALSRALAAELGAPFVLRIADAELLQHLAAQHAQGVLDAVGSEIVTAGFGPWGEQVLDDTLAAVGFTPSCSTNRRVISRSSSSAAKAWMSTNWPSPSTEGWSRASRSGCTRRSCGCCT